MKDSFFWNWQELKGTQWYEWYIGELNLRLKLDENELISQTEYPREEHSKPENRNSAAWNRFIVDREDRIGIFPSLPDRPLVLKPEASRKLPSGARTQLVFFIPIWLRLMLEKKGKEVLLAEYPSVVLSSTWFGDMQSGELCYTLNAELIQNPQCSPAEPYLAACVLNIHNNSNSMLDFSKMAVHVEHLSLFAGADGLYTNEITVQFNGAEQISQVRYSPRGPLWVESPQQFCKPREVPSRNILKRSFSFIKQLTEM